MRASARRTGQGGALTERSPRASGEEVRRRALVGVLSLALRGVGIRLLGMIGYLVSARFLSPEEFGIAGLGLALTFAASFISDGGLAAGMLRSPERPSRGMYAAVQGFQLLVLGAAVVACAAWALAAGSTVAIVTTLFVASLPLASLRTPAMISLERELKFGPSIRADLTEVLVFNLWVVGGLLAGWGVFALATGAIVKTAVGTIIMNRAAPIGWVRPRFDFGPIRQLLGFGLTFQASNAVSLARDQFLNLTIVALAGYALLGFWTIALRVASVPLLMFDSLVRVTFPAAARLLALGEDLARSLETHARRSALLFGAILAPSAVAGTVLLPFILGSDWREAGTVLPLVFLGVMLSQPISVVASGYLLAAGDARAVLRASLATAIIQLAVTAALLPHVGYLAIGVGMLIGALADGVVLAIAVRRRNGARLLRPVVPGTLSYVAAAAAGLWLARTDAVLMDVAAIPVAAAVFCVLAWLTDRRAARELVRSLAALPRRLRSQPGLDPVTSAS